MPPRFAYWTILIDNAPTAFRAREAEDLQPTLVQLRRTNQNVVLKWFARGRLWNSREEEHTDFAQRKARRSDQRRPAPRDQFERRSKDWRPGGDHKDPRARFDKKKRRDEKRAAPPPTGEKPWRDKPWQGKQRPADQRSPGKPQQGARPWHGKPRSAKPWSGKPARGGKPWESGARKPWQSGARKWSKGKDPNKKNDDE